MSKKKKKKGIAKRRTQANAGKQKRGSSRRSAPNVHIAERPALSEIVAPPGFRAVSAAQAMVEYAKPILAYVEKGVVKDPNEAFQLAMPLWNYNLSHNHNDARFDKKTIIRQIGKILKLDDQKASELFEMMIQRKEDLFPENIQPDHPMTMFVREKEHYLLSEFNYASIKLSDDPYLPDREDGELVKALNQMDTFIADHADYDDWEDHYFSMQDKCAERFEKWLRVKGVKEYSDDFPYYVQSYLDFIYLHAHDDDITFTTIMPIYIDEFFGDFVLRKVMVEPHEYIRWLPALKLFTTFLFEIGYEQNPVRIITLLDRIEPHFLEILQKRYS